MRLNLHLILKSIIMERNWVISNTNVFTSKVNVFPPEDVVGNLTSGCIKLYNVVSQIRLCVTRLKKCVWDEVMEFYYYSAHLKGCVSTL